MTSRWAYEALVVEQFKNNKFQKNFYTIDSKLSQNNYMLSFYIEKLKTIYANQVITNSSDLVANGNDYFELLKNELNKLSKKYNSQDFKDLAVNLKQHCYDSAYQVSFYNEFEKLRFTNYRSPDLL